MKLAQGLVVAGRYELAECLGTGAMGEVWRARDTRFESRLVAVKFLREDETLKEDSLNRDRMVIRLEQQASRGGISQQFALEAIASALAVTNIDGLRTKSESKFGNAQAIPTAAVTALFDELVNDPVYNENARVRAKMRRLFRDEANTVANLRHDNVVSIFDYGDHEGNPYLVMDYIEGRTLYQVIQAQEMLGRPRRLQLIEDLCAGLGYAHRHKLVHRDIKPANLIIDSSTGSLKILDFGVVRRIGSQSTIGVPVGTFCYMSPEQTRGAATLDHRSDIFAVGLVFYELMSGRKAFPPGKSIGDLVARIQRDPPTPISELVPSIPKVIEDIIGKAIEKQPETRYQDLAVMGREIARIRTRLEAAEQSERTVISMTADPTVSPVKPIQASVTELLENAERAFEAGDDHAAIEFCNRVLTQKPGFPPALSLLSRAESRQRESRLREVLQQAERLMSLEELTSAKATLSRARDIDPSSPRVRIVEEKLEAAIAARSAELERAERERLERLKPPAFVAPPVPAMPPEQDPAFDPDGVTRPLPRGAVGRPPVPASNGRVPVAQPPDRTPPPGPPSFTPPPPSFTPAAPASADLHGETMLVPSLGGPPKLQPPPPRRTGSSPRQPVVSSPPPLPQTPIDGPTDGRPAAPPSMRSLETTTPASVPPDDLDTPVPPFEQDAEEPRADLAPSDIVTRPLKPISGVRRARRIPTGDVASTDEFPAPAGLNVPPARSGVRPPAAPAPAPPAQPAAQSAASPPPVRPAVASDIPAPKPRSGNWLGLVVAGALVAVLVISIAALVLRRGGGDTPAPQQQQPPQQQQAQTPAPGQPPATPPKQDSTPDPNATAATPPVDAAPAASALTSVTIDLRPWARVKIVPAAPDPSVPADALYSPFTLDLPAGTYTLECENGGVTRPTTIQLTVVEGTPQTIVRNMPGFNATKAVDALLGQ